MIVYDELQEIGAALAHEIEAVEAEIFEADALDAGLVDTEIIDAEVAFDGEFGVPIAEIPDASSVLEEAKVDMLDAGNDSIPILDT